MQARVVEGAESRPGVYRMLSASGAVVYVGKAKRLRTRLLSYFNAKRGKKSARILREARTIDWTYQPSELAALREELRLIKLYRPTFNLQQKRDAEFYAFVHITGGEAPRVEVARGGARGDGVFYGPFIGPNLVESAARELSDALGLRDCSDRVRLYFADRPPTPKGLRPPDCIRHDVGKCIGPCIAACTTSDYASLVADAHAFLQGHSERPIESLTTQMETAKRALAYEHAGVLRDRRARLEKLRDQLGKLRASLEDLSCVYPVPGYGGDDRVYLIRRGTVRRELPAPKSTADRIALQTAIDEVFSPNEATQISAHDIEEILLISAWFRAHPEELARAKEISIPV
jgi:excinuclease UvrABC nuclease subunit